MTSNDPLLNPTQVSSITLMIEADKAVAGSVIFTIPVFTTHPLASVI
jgi:hypothetical protein